MTTTQLERNIARYELITHMADYLERFIGLSRENAKSYAEDVIDSWHLFVERSDSIDCKKK